MNAERAFVDARRAVVAITADIAPIVAVLEGDAATAEEVEASFIALCELIRAAGRALIFIIESRSGAANSLSSISPILPLHL